MVMIVGGLNQRKDFHVEDGEEWFFRWKATSSSASSRTARFATPILEGDVPLPPGIPIHRSVLPIRWDWSSSAPRRTRGEREPLREVRDRAARRGVPASGPGQAAQADHRELLQGRGAPDLQEVRSRDGLARIRPRAQMIE